jgi:hypothetical protein
VYDVKHLRHLFPTMVSNVDPCRKSALPGATEHNHIDGRFFGASGKNSIQLPQQMNIENIQRRALDGEQEDSLSSLN